MESEIYRLRKEGFAIVVITPDELKGWDASAIEDNIRNMSLEYIRNLKMEDYPEDNFRDDVEADADTLKSAGWGTDEDYRMDDYS